MEKYHGKYRIESARLKNWDYGSPGFYFITICTKNRECFFGDIVTPNVGTPRVETQNFASLQRDGAPQHRDAKYCVSQ